MAESKIPVDLFNPGQVFACLGFMELANVLLGDAEAGFDWSDKPQTVFFLSTSGDDKPVEVVLEFLASASVESVTPVGYIEPSKKKADAKDGDDEEDDEEAESESGVASDAFSEIFPAKAGDATSLPVRLVPAKQPVIEVSHWADGSSRNTFKLYAGNRSAEKIAKAMLKGVRQKPKRGQAVGDLKYKGIRQLWDENKDDLIANPFNVLTPIGGSFNFDPRGAWTALDAGYSPNTQKHGVAASPLVHLLAACGLEHTRPAEFGVRQVRYCAWSGVLPVSLARVAFQGGIPSLPTRHFRFELALSGKNKIVTLAQQENAL
ncbi:type I-U CRISPR-associated protein Cas8c [Acidihalobacter ferrooxydans]|uniref:Type I-U CRISPR-associated protein Cas8c n=1 Tax=Acidihalobacter ferrooxydans TaxID=1765967 RepID=A0A1P8UKH8_9GAMM|nr:type I-U CRISPR-associated protein Cas8c [Acidihalobacter ferrooxydans]APZ44304.1 type I-U CRISPR-associated protein Cas8c [Acidihalobacter ferrooxydans]